MHACTHTHSVNVSFGVLLLKCCRDEEGVCLGVFMLPNLNADLWDSNTNLIQEPQQSVVIYCICKGERVVACFPSFIDNCIFINSEYVHHNTYFETTVYLIYIHFIYSHICRHVC